MFFYFNNLCKDLSFSFFSSSSAGRLFKHYRHKLSKALFNLKFQVWPVDESGDQGFSLFQ